MPIKLSEGNIVSILGQRADKHPLKPAFRYFTNLEEQPSILTYRQLDEKARAVAAELQQRNVRGERALLIYPTGLDFIAAFMGCLYAGVIAIPVWPPTRKQSTLNLENIIEDATPKLALTTSHYSQNLQDFIVLSKKTLNLQWVETDTIDTAGGNHWQEIEVDENEVAYLQYTSGSTSQPRGVKISHKNIISNAIIIEEYFSSHSETIGLSWLPHYHDMGLVGKILEPIYTGCQIVFTSPQTFMKRPLLWLKAISHFKATISGGPNYAYDLCVTMAKNNGINQLDLSSWEVAVNGAEPVHAKTIQRFSEIYKPYGFNPKAFCPSYGLAESTLLVTGIKMSEFPKIESFDLESLAKAKASDPVEGKPVKEIVSCGLVKSNDEVVIVSSDSSTICRGDEIGEIWLQGPSVSEGYWNSRGNNGTNFGASIPTLGENRYLQTGDLGFIKGGHLYITGRKKDLIILGGQNFYPQDIENLAEESHPVIRPNGSVSFQIEKDGREQIILVTEIKAPYKKENYAEITSAIRSSLVKYQYIPIDRIILVKKGTLPKTPSGKIRRFLCRQHFQEGKLAILDEGIPQLKVEAKSDDHSAPKNRIDLSSYKEEDLKKLILNKVAHILGVTPMALKDNQPLYEQGLSSLRTVELTVEIEGLLGIKIDQENSLQGLTIDQLMRTIRKQPVVQEDESIPASGNRALQTSAPESKEEIDVDSRFDPTLTSGSNILEAARSFTLFDQLRDSDQMPFFQALDNNEGTVCTYQGKRTIMLGSNNYLGLTADSRVREAASRAALEEGPSLTGSRLLNGTTEKHEKLEKKLATFLGYEDALVFTTGYQANLGLLSALLNQTSYLILDDESHASMYDGAFLSKCHVKEFRHNDMSDLERKLSEVPSECGRLVMIDGVYSMQGDITSLPEINRICKKWDTPFVVDEAHALGVLGDTGRGTQEHFNLKEKADLLTGTFSKSLASIGGWIAGETKVIDWIRFHARPMLFSASLPPPSIAAASTALDILMSEPWRIKKVTENAYYFRKSLIEAGFDVVSSQTPISAIRICNDLITVQFAKRLLKEGVFVNACVYPAVQKNSALIRTSVIATHDKALLDDALVILKRVGKELGII